MCSVYRQRERQIVDRLLSKMNKYIDVIVPRGGKGLVAKVQKISNVHVIVILKVSTIYMLTIALN